MQFFTLATLLLAGSVTAFAGTLEKRATPKANEYTSTFIKPFKDALEHIQLTGVWYRHRLVSKTHLERAKWTLHPDIQLILFSQYSSGPLNFGYVEFEPLSTHL